MTSVALQLAPAVTLCPPCVSVPSLLEQVSAIVLTAGGAMYDPSDLTSIYQGRTGGSTGAVSSPVGIVLGKPGGLSAAAYIAAQPELVTNGGFNSDTGWTHSGSAIAGGVLTVTRTSGFVHGDSAGISVVSGLTYLIVGECRRNSGTGNATVQVRNGGGTQREAFSPADAGVMTSFAFIHRAVATETVYIWCGIANAAAVIDFDNISTRGIPGIHSIAPSDSARPILQVGYIDFDGVNDVLNAQVPTSLGSNVSVYTRTHAGANVWLTGQTIGAGSYALSTTDWKSVLLIPGGVTAGEQATIEAWGASL